MKQPVLAYLALAFGISWSIYAVAKWGLGITGTLAWTLASALFMFGPGIAALLQRKAMGLRWGDLGAVTQGIRWKWMGLAVLLAMALPPLTLLFNGLLGNVLHLGAFGQTALTKDMLLRVTEGMLKSGNAPSGSGERVATLLKEAPLNGPAILLIFLVVGALAGCTVNFVFAMGEELGWRGILSHHLRQWGFPRQVLFTGVVWGLWHAPLILEWHNYTEHPVAGVAFMCLFNTAMAWPLAIVRERSRCVWSAGLMHGTVNGVAGASTLFVAGGSPILSGGAGLSAVLALVAIGVVLHLSISKNVTA